ncbi:MAG: penicillin-insensitive murein endopeptidase [Methyloceanibacter sp.]
MRRLILGLTLTMFCAAAAAQGLGAQQTAATPTPPKPVAKPAVKKPPVKKSPIARQLFGAAPGPAPLAARSIGGYAKGCLAGGVSLPINGPDWQVMRLSRNRNWGNPRLLDYLERLASDARALDDWPGLLVGDMSQPRGGPMLTGHTSHQIGLDADIWLTPMPDHIMTPQEREDMSAVSMLKDPFSVDPSIFTLAHVKLIRRAASYPQVARIFVHPAIKKALCQMAPQVGKDTSWLGKVRPWWNHHYHFHIRLTCPPGSEGCENQKPASGDNGCGQELTNWYAMLKKSAIEMAKPPVPGAKPWVGKPPLTMAQLPKECGTVLTSGGFEPPVPAEGDASVTPPAVLAAMATKDAGPPVPILSPAQLKELTGGGADPAGMPLPDRNPLR